MYIRVTGWKTKVWLKYKERRFTNCQENIAGRRDKRYAIRRLLDNGAKHNRQTGRTSQLDPAIPSTNHVSKFALLFHIASRYRQRRVCTVLVGAVCVLSSKQTGKIIKNSLQNRCVSSVSVSVVLVRFTAFSSQSSAIVKNAIAFYVCEQIVVVIVVG